jgi:Glycosyltransferase family 87
MRRSVVSLRSHLRVLCGPIRQRLYYQYCLSHCCPIRGPVLWSLSGLIAYFLAAEVTTVARRDRLQWLTAIMLSPGVFTCFMYGQTAFLTSAALITGFLVARRRPAVAGVCFALLAAKPQIALVVPVVLAALGAWRTLAATVLFVGIYAGATVAAFGIEPWQRFIDSTLPQQFAILNLAHIKAVMMISPYFMFRELDGRFRQATACSSVSRWPPPDGFSSPFATRETSMSKF